MAEKSVNCTEKSAMLIPESEDQGDKENIRQIKQAVPTHGKKEFFILIDIEWEQWILKCYDKIWSCIIDWLYMLSPDKSDKYWNKFGILIHSLYNCYISVFLFYDVQWGNYIALIIAGVWGA